MLARKKIINRIHKSKLLKYLFFNPLAEYHQWRLLRFVNSAASCINADKNIIDIGAG